MGKIVCICWKLYTEIMATPEIPADLPPMMEFKKQADAIIFEKYGIQVEHIRAKNSYEEFFYEVKQRGKDIGSTYGFPYGMCAWCQSRLKINVLSKLENKNNIQYIGYAIDEKNKKRQEKIKQYIENKKNKFVYPLVDFNKTEQEAYDWCKENNLLSPTYLTSMRGGCWFCHNQSLYQLRILRDNYPEYWKMMLKWDKDSPTSFKTDGTTIHDLEKRFVLEDKWIKDGKGNKLKTKEFFKELKEIL